MKGAKSFGGKMPHIRAERCPVSGLKGKPELLGLDFGGSRICSGLYIYPIPSIIRKLDNKKTGVSRECQVMITDPPDTI
jgi:hypothetical protein